MPRAAGRRRHFCTRPAASALAVIALTTAGLGGPAAPDSIPPAASAPELERFATGDIPEPSAACGPAIVAEFSWTTAELAARVLEIVLTDAYGCEVERRPADPSRVATAVARSHQALARALEDAPPLGGAPLEEPPAVIAIGVAATQIPPGAAIGAETYGGRERGGWFTQRWLVDANPELRRIEDAAKRPELFAVGATEKPKLHVCPAAWPCHADDMALAARLGLQDRFEIVVPASGDALTASLAEAWRTRRPWIGSYWTPSAAVAEHAMIRLKSGALEICAEAADGDGAATCRPPHQTTARVALYPQALRRRAPETAAFLRRFATPPGAVLEALSWRARANADLTDAALHLLETQPDLWRSWLDASARQRFEPALQARIAAARGAAAAAKRRRMATPQAGGDVETEGGVAVELADRAEPEIEGPADAAMTGRAEAAPEALAR